MNVATRRVAVVAVIAGALGLLASLWYGGSPLLRTETVQRGVQALMEASAPAPPAGVTPARRGDLMPPISLPDLQGARQDLRSAFSRRPLLINVWASWCGPCIEEMPELNRYARLQGEDGVQIVGLALDTPENVRWFLGRVPVSYPIVLDTPGPADASVWLGNARGVLPYTVLVSSDGRILKQKVGPFAAGEIDAWASDAR